MNNLEREIEFLKSEISTKNKIIKKLLNNICQNKSCSMVGETWDFDVTHETSDSQSTCSTSNSLVEFRDVNTVNIKITNMTVDDQLKLITEEKHEEYLLNTGCKSPSLENTKNNKTTKQFCDPQGRKENLNETGEIYKEFHWPSGTCVMICYTMVNGINKKNYTNMTML